eukprot:UN1374
MVHGLDQEPWHVISDAMLQAPSSEHGWLAMLVKALAVIIKSGYLPTTITYETLRPAELLALPAADTTRPHFPLTLRRRDFRAAPHGLITHASLLTGPSR